MSLKSWQSVLDFLTQMAAEEDFLGRLTKRNEKEIIVSCFKMKNYRSHLRKWMDDYLNASNILKSSEESVSYRSKGNDKFKARDNEGSLHFYSKSILVAPTGSEEYAVGLANRSAVLFDMKQYKVCSRDIKMALELETYPKHLLHKLLLRQARCLKHLEDFDECRRVIEKLWDHLATNKEIIPQKKSDEIHEEIDTILLSLDSPKNVPPMPSLRDSARLSCEIPEPKGGFNPSFASASRCVELKYTQEKGRHVFATASIKKGDIIFVEKPYTSVVLPNQYMIHCHHCCQRTYAPIPCRSCCQALFCSRICQDEADAKYHSYECGALPMMWSIGIAHLGLRTVIVSGPPDAVVKRAERAALHFSSNAHTLGDPDDAYSAVFGLKSHVEDMFPEDAFQYAMTAVLLGEYLLRKTSYFSATCCNSDALAEGICAVILRHIAQLVCNAHALTKIDRDKASLLEAGGVVAESQQRIATAIYPSASMMNHSCDPNISNSFFKNTLVVKASRDIAAEEEIFNCYGPHRARMSTGHRQAALQAQYFFHCTCTACSRGGMEPDDTTDRSAALSCATCKGPLLAMAPGRQPAGAKESALAGPTAGAAGRPPDAPPGRYHDDLSQSVHRMVCAHCGTSQTISVQVEGSFRARYLFNQGLDALRAGDVNEALSTFLQCRELQLNCLYRTHTDLAATHDHIAKCYAVLGKYRESIPCLWEVISATEEQFGLDSIEVAHELRKLSDVMIHDIRSSKPEEQAEMRLEAKQVILRAQNIFCDQYGEWDSNWPDLESKLQELNLKP